jgi:hypothetical protein
MIIISIDLHSLMGHIIKGNIFHLIRKRPSRDWGFFVLYTFTRILLYKYED